MGGFLWCVLLRRDLFMPWELDKVLDYDMVVVGLQELQPVACICTDIEKAKLNSLFAKVATLEASQYMRNQLLRDTD